MARPSRLLLHLALLSAFFCAGIAGATEHRIVAPPGTGVGLPFSPAVEAGDFLYLSGALGNEPGTLEVPGGTVVQTRRTLDNLKTVLETAGLGFDRVVEATVYLADIRYDGEVEAALNEGLAGTTAVRTTVEADIALPAARLEVAMVAARPGVEVKAVNPPQLPAPPTGRSWGQQAGDTLFIAGMDGVAEAPAGGTKEQAKAALARIDRVVTAAGMGRDDLVTCRVYLAEPRDFGDLNEAWREFFANAAPARATVRARGTDPEARVTIQCIAVAGEDKATVATRAEDLELPFSPGVRAGDRLFLAGMVGRGPFGYPEGVGAQTRIVLDRLTAVLKAAKMDLGDVQEAVVFLKDIRDYAAMNAVYAQAVGDLPPARATVGSQLMSSEALVEIQMTATRAPEKESGDSSP